MSTFVLVHGAWHGGWCWRRVTPALRAAGHEVLTPTLTGVGDRAHLISPLVGLETHVEDVVRLIDAETDGDGDVVLVGHSYAGMVITGVADRRPARVRQRVYLDAFLPTDGEAAIDLLPAHVAGHYRESVAGPGHGWLIPPRSLQVLGVTEPDDLDWLTPRLTPHPWRSYAEPLRIGAAVDDVPGAFVECVDWMRVFTPYAQRARDRGWRVLDLPTGHEAMVTAPKALAEALLRLVG
ncbi:alpha/beta fold hydrolase [Plantactinospora soyae]|uniref:Pimeloyl-ACP methyl ester carboxylesterase n=1 Tax=Plantactinospora soyae TaxID=1544732 RepID=A0A927R9G7_9ACTN|nr:alpha/beta fold hydrolase [Plantactinospora soyae]MBE1489781.1 pimeloyl-ACP methyl ester carboxylesterase [Plantactinospora soyae]